MGGGGGEGIPGFYPGDGSAAGGRTTGRASEGSDAGGATAAEKSERAGRATSSHRCSGGVRGSRSAEAGSAEPRSECGRGHAERRAITARAEPARRDGGNPRGRYRKRNSAGKQAEDFSIVFHPPARRQRNRAPQHFPNSPASHLLGKPPSL